LGGVGPSCWFPFPRGCKKGEIRPFFLFHFFFVLLHSVFLVFFSKHEHIDNQHSPPPSLGYLSPSRLPHPCIHFIVSPLFLNSPCLYDAGILCFSFLFLRGFLFLGFRLNPPLFSLPKKKTASPSDLCFFSLHLFFFLLTKLKDMHGLKLGSAGYILKVQYHIKAEISKLFVCIVPGSFLHCIGYE